MLTNCHFSLDVVFKMGHHKAIHKFYLVSKKNLQKLIKESHNASMASLYKHYNNKRVIDNIDNTIKIGYVNGISYRKLYAIEQRRPLII